MTSMKINPAVEPCSCGSGREYPDCCGRYHAGAVAPTPETLMRSRYSAYVRRLALYLLVTWHPSRRPTVEELDLDPATKWLGLKIVRAELSGDDAGTVEFVARYRIGGGSAVRLHELSRFVRENGAWFYIDGEHRDR